MHLFHKWELVAYHTIYSEDTTTLLFACIECRNLKTKQIYMILNDEQFEKLKEITNASLR